MRLASGIFLMAIVAAVVAPAQTETTGPHHSLESLMESGTFTNDTEMVMIRVSPDLWVSRTHVTQKEWMKIMSRNPSHFKGENKPVDSISYTEATHFCTDLNEAERKAQSIPAGWTYTLPTQAEWEHLAADTKLENSVTSMRSKKSGTTDVASLPANALGLYDMRGLLWHWCLDPQDKPYRVLRGGAWDTSIEVNLRPEFRWYSRGPDDRQNTFGFRVVLKSRI